MASHADNVGPHGLIRFAEEARERIARIDPEIAQWVRQALIAADPYPPTRAAARELGLDPAVPIAVGKAAVPMALAWQEATGQAGLAVVPRGIGVPPGLSRWQVIEGEHPVPGPGSHRAGRAVLERASSGKDIVLLLSGGASSMMEAATVDEHEHAEISRRLHSLGLPIATWNAARAMLSRLKAGGLAAAVEASGGTLHTLFVSDVPDDDPRVVGSGPGMPIPQDELESRIEGLPHGLQRRLTDAGARRPPAPGPSEHRLLVPRDAPARGAEEAIRRSGYTPRLLDPIDMDVEDAVPIVTHALTSAQEDEIIVAWGEPLVTPPEDGGPGGRTTHMLCALWSEPEAHNAVAALMTTDGLDGASGFGGCYAKLVPRRTQQAQTARDTWQTAAFLRRLPPTTGGGVPGTSTGANCADIGILRPPRRTP